jgi:hypothetical protein
MSEEIRVETPATVMAAARVRRVSWGAIFAGMFVTICLQIMFTLLGAAVGIAKLQGGRFANPAPEIATASGIWLLVTGLVSLWIGSCIAGRLSGGPLRSDGLVHGVVTWSFSTLIMFALLATSLGTLLGGTSVFFGGALASQTGTEPGGGLAGAQSGLNNAAAQGRAALSPTGRTPEQAAADQQAQQSHSQAAGSVGRSGRGIEQGLLWAFVALVLGLIVAAWGGWTGTASLPEIVENVPA